MPKLTAMGAAISVVLDLGTPEVLGETMTVVCTPLKHPPSSKDTVTLGATLHCLYA